MPLPDWIGRYLREIGCHKILICDLPPGLAFDLQSYAHIGTQGFEDSLEVALTADGVYFRRRDRKEAVFWLPYSEIGFRENLGILQEYVAGKPRYFILISGERLDLGEPFEQAAIGKVTRVSP